MARAIVVFVIIALWMSATPGQAAPAYTIRDLTLTTPMGQADAYGVNDSGVVTGHRYLGGHYMAYTWSESSGVKDLGNLPTGTSSMGVAINGGGTVAGWAWTNTTGNLHGVVWKPGQPITDLGALPGNNTSDSSDINDGGWTVGRAGTTDGKNHGVVWNAAGVIQDLGCLPGDNYSYAQAIANNGLVVGYSFSTADYLTDLFTWTHDGGLVNRGRPAGAKSVGPTKINNLGQASCYVWSTSGQLSFAIWSESTGFVPASSYGMSTIYDINDNGMMLGKRSSDGKLVVRYPDSSTSLLPYEGTQRPLVSGMNNLGWVVGFYSSTRHAVLWQPILPNRPPVASAKVNGQDETTVELATPEGTQVELDGLQSSDPDGDPLTYQWDFESDGAYDATGSVVNHTYPLGTHTATLKVTDPDGASSTDTAVINVVDTTPPEIISVTVTPSVLWPPNHKKAPIVITVQSEDIGESPIAWISEITSNEPVNGLGDGDRSPDWEITGPLSAWVRAERSGMGSGRVYTFCIQCADLAGNVSSVTTTVAVPRD